jgi:Asp-tRNA(Asn)/Glu-tRNA(Gln) amidotransferase A subunit family amidase
VSELRAPRVPTKGAQIGVPVGSNSSVPCFSGAQLLQIAYGFEQTAYARKPPQFTMALNGRELRK